ncbi:MAG TPA: hypothetical protein VMU39_22790 [Solirubrobacteraceae bacterium]|nr:hypothetical protein [Solirubrobacteraceae bacterium]
MDRSLAAPTDDGERGPARGELRMREMLLPMMTSAGISPHTAKAPPKISAKVFVPDDTCA